ncbi:MAG: glutamate-1-semialdehyde 2,1-aminomutase, partial [Flavobacteriales bacterium]|nr:glutamate-1-semialdehyde 2,1-aminomutase [Flavobacteriales bacterium]
TMDVFENNNVIEHNHAIGDHFIKGLNGILDRRGLQDYFDITGFNWSVGLIVKNAQKQPCLFYRTLFMQEMIQRGVLYQGILSPCYSHTIADIDFMLAAFDASCDVFEKALQDGYEKYLVGPEIKPVFRKFN